MPNELTVDINANERLDIMRCKMNNGEESYMNLARSNQEITVEIFREKVSLVVFTVPWNTRVQSRFLSHPRDVQGDNSMGTSSNPRASIFDPWMGFNKSTPGVWEREKLFMCVPGLESPPSREVRTTYSNNTLLKNSIVFNTNIESLTISDNAYIPNLTLIAITSLTTEFTIVPRVHTTPPSHGCFPHLYHCCLCLGWEHNEILTTCSAFLH